MIRFIQQILAAATPITAEAKSRVRYCIGAIATLGAPLSLILACFFPGLRTFLLCVWALLPPMWFWYEYHCLYQPGEDLEHFKHGQGISRTIWAGVLAALIVLKLTGKPVSSVPAAGASQQQQVLSDRDFTGPTPPPLGASAAGGSPYAAPVSATTPVPPPVISSTPVPVATPARARQSGGSSPSPTRRPRTSDSSR